MRQDYSQETRLRAHIVSALLWSLWIAGVLWAFLEQLTLPELVQRSLASPEVAGAMALILVVPAVMVVIKLAAAWRLSQTLRA
jgi:hypothetical protein